MHLVLAEVQAADVAGELLFEPGAELVGVRRTVLLQVSVIVQRGRLSIADFGSTEVDSDHAFIVCVEDELEFVLVCAVGRAYQFDRLFADVGMVLDCDALFCPSTL